MTSFQTGGHHGRQVKTQSDGGSFQELERINKEIESVKHEVEQEQRRLWHYHSTSSKSPAGPHHLSPGKTLSPPAAKYVVDISKPRTDLEYDPLSNFSAGLRSAGSSGKEPKVRLGGVKRGRNVVPSCSPAPEPLDDSYEDWDLIIDVPPSPDTKRARAQKSLQGELNTDTLTASANQPNGVQCHDLLSLYEDQQAADGSDTEVPVALEDEQSPKASPVQVCEAVVEKSPEEVTNQSDICNNLLVKTENPLKMNRLQPLDFSPKNSIFYKAPDADSASPCRRICSERPFSECAASLLPNQAAAAAAAAPGGHLEDSGSDLRQDSPRHQSDNPEVIVISSSSEDEELHYSDMDVSDSDPEEECYRIFMEANEEQVTDVPQVEDVEKPALEPGPPAPTGRKRVSYEAKNTEPAAKSRPQPQVLVPLREPVASAFTSHTSIPNKIQHIQHRASVLTASVRGAQLVSSVCHRKSDIHSLQSAPVHHAAYMNYIPLGSSVLGVDDDLRLILPGGTFPLPASSSSSHVPSVLTPVSLPGCSMYHPATLGSVQRHRASAPLIIPALARKPSVTSALSTAHPAPAAAAAVTPQTAAVKPAPSKRKSKQQHEAAKDKVPRDIRQRYVSMFMEEILKTTANVNDAFEKALSEEKTVYNRSVNKLKYLSVAVNALKRLKNQSALAAKGVNEVHVQRSKGNISLNLKKLKGNEDAALYESLKDYVLPEESLVENNFPVQHPEELGRVVLFADNKKSSADPLKRICCRCGSTYAVNRTGKPVRREECNYHYGKGVTKRVPGGVETRYRCCEGVMGAPGCQVFQSHVHDALSLEGFISTRPKHPSDSSCPGVYALDCEMCFTINGLELSRVTVVNSSLQVIYDTFVTPESDVIDYNTRFSGVTEQEVKGSDTSLTLVQETLLSFISAGTVLIGHGLDSALCALKLLHEMVVDTSVVFPHRLGPPHKLSLNHLTAEHLRRILQESACGHDTAEDAAACMELMLWKLKEDGKMKK